MTVRLGTRASALALAQSRTVAEAFTRATGRPVELVEIITVGDRSTAPVDQLGVGVFVSALREALLAKEIDVAVHSFKDLPTAAAEGLCLAAVPPREDPRDALVTRAGQPLAGLPSGARIGTGAPRRTAQLRALGLPLELVAVRGNVDTRLRRVAEGELDGVVLARAGLRRLGRASEITEVLDPGLVLPAPAQGALAVEARADDTELVTELAGALDDQSTKLAVTAERAMLATLEAGCRAPVAGLASLPGPDQAAAPGQTFAGGRLALRGMVIRPDGGVVIKRSRTTDLPAGEAAEEAARRLGTELAEELQAAGADSILKDMMREDPGGQGGWSHVPPGAGRV